MPSPFPGMDPYLEGYLWPDFHHAVPEEIRRQLTPKLRPRYVARVSLRFVADEAEESIGILLPDVEILPGPSAHQPTPEPGPSNIPAAPLVLPIAPTVPVRLATVEIRDAAEKELVTSIEILSPVNKRGPGWEEYQTKRQKVMQSRAHLLEIDLLRHGRRPIERSDLPRAPYFIFLTRAPLHQLEVWPIQLRDPLPTLPVPLLSPDPDVPLDLGAALNTIYDAAGYDLDINYRQPPDPPLEGDDAAWATALLGANGR